MRLQSKNILCTFCVYLLTTYKPIFLQFRNFKIVYRRYAGLYFCICVDIADNNLAYLEAIHNFVEVLNEYFHNVCELDLVFNFYKVGNEICRFSNKLQLPKCLTTCLLTDFLDCCYDFLSQLYRSVPITGYILFKECSEGY